MRRVSPDRRETVVLRTCEHIAPKSISCSVFGAITRGASCSGVKIGVGSLRRNSKGAPVQQFSGLLYSGVVSVVSCGQTVKAAIKASSPASGTPFNSQEELKGNDPPISLAISYSSTWPVAGVGEIIAVPSSFT